jgi:hypothetical protein
VVLQVFEQEMQLGPAAALENLQQLLVSCAVRAKALHTLKQQPQPFTCNSWDGLHPLAVQ